MFDRFWDPFGRVLGALGETFGGQGRVLEPSSGSLFGRVVPKGSQRAILEDLASIFGRFGAKREPKIESRGFQNRVFVNKNAYKSEVYCFNVTLS